MAQESSFFNAQLINGAYDRVYNAENWAAYFASFLGNGVSIVPKTTLQVQAGTGMTVIVDKGIAFINGYRYANTMPYEITINPANATYARISIVILELNLNERNILLKVIDGTPSDMPIAPALTRTSGIYQLQLASILIQPGSTQISNIIDTRNDSSVCGFIEGLFGQSGVKVEDQIIEINEKMGNLLNTYLTNKSSPILSNNWTFDNNANLYFNNSNHENLVGLAVKDNRFTISNCLQGKSVLTWVPTATTEDMLSIPANLDITGNITTTANLNMAGNVQINGTTIWAGGNSNDELNPDLIGQFSVSVPGETNAAVNYSIQYWTMDMSSVVNPSTLPNAGIGIITITLQGNGNWNWTGNCNLNLVALAGVTLMNTMPLVNNPQFDITFEAEMGILCLNNINIVANPSGNANSYTTSVLIYG